MVLDYTKFEHCQGGGAVLLQFINCRVLRDSTWQNVDFWVENGKIVNPEPIFFVEKRRAKLQIDCHGLLLVPGYIDVQINGGFGVDFSSPTNLRENMQAVSGGLLKYGVTAYCPTIISSQAQAYKQIIPQIECTRGGKDGAAVLGLHLEGPFISPFQHGCHPLKNVCSLGFPNGLQDLVDMYTEAGLKKTRIITIAPELPGAITTIEWLMEEYQNRIRVSLGHSAGDLRDGEKAFKRGASGITHLFNAMNTFHHRDPGLLGLLTSKYILSGLPLYYGLISDGIHTHDSALRIAHRTAPNNGIHNLGELTVEVKGIKANLVDTKLMAGSVCSLDACVRHFVNAAHITPLEAIECATLHPAQFLGIESERGSLNFGCRADFLLLDDDLNVKATFIDGQKVWSSNN